MEQENGESKEKRKRKRKRKRELKKRHVDSEVRNTVPQHHLISRQSVHCPLFLVLEMLYFEQPRVHQAGTEYSLKAQVVSTSLFQLSDDRIRSTRRWRVTVGRGCHLFHRFRECTWTIWLYVPYAGTELIFPFFPRRTIHSQHVLSSEHILSEKVWSNALTEHSRTLSPFFFGSPLFLRFVP